MGTALKISFIIRQRTSIESKGEKKIRITIDCKIHFQKSCNLVSTNSIFRLANWHIYFFQNGGNILPFIIKTYYLFPMKYGARNKRSVYLLMPGTKKIPGMFLSV